ncbi:MAG: AAA family ATPase [Prevotella sp.]|nr:AAA family ATPase [Prevotella sp.]
MIKNEYENVQPQNAGQVDNQVAQQAVCGIVDKAVAQPTAEEQAKEQLRQVLRETRIRTYTDVPAEKYTLAVTGTDGDVTEFFVRGDIHAVKAKAKAGKTTALKVMLATLLKGEMFRLQSLIEKPRILYFDTEQSRTDTKHILDDVVKMTGLGSDVIDSQVSLHSLRRVDQDQLLPLLRQAIEDKKPDVVFIDGIVEFVASFNDEVESKGLIKDLLLLAQDNDCAIVCVLHTNKSDDDHNMRGHLGSFLTQKAATVLECKKEKGSSVITVACTEARHKEPAEWSITFAPDGTIVSADEQRLQIRLKQEAEKKQKQEAAKEAKREQKLQENMRVAQSIIHKAGDSISRSELNSLWVKQTGLDRSTISRHIKALIEAGKLVENNKIITVATVPAT